jgi:hypothetical protein
VDSGTKNRSGWRQKCYLDIFLRSMLGCEVENEFYFQGPRLVIQGIYDSAVCARLLLGSLYNAGTSQDIEV